MGFAAFYFSRQIVMTKAIPLKSAVIAFLCFLPTICHAAEPVISGRVTKVSDGDTIRIEGHKPRIRLWGVDAPELKNRGGKKSKAYLTGLVFGQTVTCTIVGDDRYRRTVARCDLGAADIGGHMISTIHASEYCRYSKGYYGTCDGATTPGRRP